jgi:hypothetical protein
MDIENSAGAIDMDSNGVEVDDTTMVEQDRLLGNLYHAHSGAFCNQPAVLLTRVTIETILGSSDDDSSDESSLIP